MTESEISYRAVIFDCDGVMFDSEDSNIAYYNHILHRFGYPSMPREDYPIIQMVTGEQTVRHLFRDYPEQDEAENYRRLMDYTPFIDKLQMEPGLVELLIRLRGRCRLAVATNRSTTVGAVLERFRLADYFDLVVSAFDVKRPKPDPECLLKILDRFSISAHEALFVGDSKVDAETAAAAGVPFAAFKNPSLKAPLHVRSMTELASVVIGKI